MKEFILKILFFFLIIAFVDLGVGFWGDYMIAHAKGGLTRRTYDLVMKDRHDVVIMGSSRAHHHYDASYLGKSLGLDVYNAGYDGNGVVLAYGIMALIMERYKPKMIIYDIELAFDVKIYKLDNNNIRYLTSLKPYYRHKGVEDIFKKVSLKEWLKVHSGLIRYNSNLLTIVLDNLFLRGDFEKDGYEPLFGEYNGPGTKTEKIAYENDNMKLDFIKELILLAKKNNVSIVMVGSPRFDAVSSEELNTVAEICKTYDVPFLNFYNDEIFVGQNALFKDPMHLNANGAKIFSELIANKIKQIKKQLLK